MKLQQAWQVSERRVCRAICFSRSVYRYKSRKIDSMPVRNRIRELAYARPRYGNQRIHILLRREGWVVGKNRVHRLYRLEGLNLTIKRKRCKSSPDREVRMLPGKVNQCWSMDFVHDQLFNGKRIRFLTVVDIYSRECLAIGVGQRLTGEDVVEQVKAIAIE